MQYSSIFATYFDKDERLLYVGGNHYKVKPQFGRQDASQGWKVKVENKERKLEFGNCDMLFVKGQIRDIEFVNNQLLFGINNDKIKVLNKR